jgi:3-methyladenine DNA glycosylase AlkD
LNSSEIIRKLKTLKNQRNINGMAQFGIRGENILGVPKPVLDQLARAIGKDHELALKLWDSRIHEARILAALIDLPEEVTPAQMEKWVKDFDSWDICDCCCGHLFDRSSLAYRKALEWSHRKREYEKRAGYVLMAEMAVHDKTAPDKVFLSFLPVIRRESRDERNFVKKAVNWALRQIGKRNRRLNRAAISEAKRIRKSGTPSARWIAADALRELANCRPKDLPRSTQRAQSKN